MKKLFGLSFLIILFFFLTGYFTSQSVREDEPYILNFPEATCSSDSFSGTQGSDKKLPAYTSKEYVRNGVFHSYTGFINEEGKLIKLPHTIYTPGCDNEGCDNDNSGVLQALLNSDYRTIVREEISNPFWLYFSNGLKAIDIHENGRKKASGFINTDGKLVIAPVYDNVGAFVDGLAPVHKNNRAGYIDTKGNFIISPQFSYAQCFSDGLAPVQSSLAGKRSCWGYIDKKGNYVIKPTFQRAGSFNGGKAKVKKVLPDRRIQYCLIDNQGRDLKCVRSYKPGYGDDDEPPCL